MRYIDLTHTFSHPMPAYPGDPPPELTQVTTIAKDGYTDHRLSTLMHVGTHMDAPLHMIDGGSYMDEIDVSTFFGRGVLLDARERKTIDDEVLSGVEIGKGDIVLIYTGHSALFGKPEYFEGYPQLSMQFAEAMTKAGVHIVGMDFLSPDNEPFPIHKELLGHGTLIVENLTNLEALLGVSHFDVIALPARLHTDASPVRVVAKVG